LLFTGKGGAGTTTVAAATATSAAQRGYRTLVVSVDEFYGLAAAVDHPLGPEPVELEPGLFGQQIDLRRAFERRWRAVEGLLAPAFVTAGMEPIEAEELSVLPCVAETLTLLELRDQLNSGRFDVVVLDAGPIAQALRLLAFPETVAAYGRRLTPVEGFVARTAAPAFALGRGGRLAGVAQPIYDAVASLSRATRQAGRLLSDPATTSVRLVLTPETGALNPVRQTFTALSLHGFQVDAVVVNRVVTADGGDVWRAGWAAAHRDQLAEADESFGDVAVLRAAFRAGEPVGLEELAAFAAAAYGGGDPTARLTGLSLVSGTDPLLERTDYGFSLSFGLPLADRTEVDLARLGDDLVVTVGTHRRCVPLPAALRRCDVHEASLRDDRLVVSFVPDPDQWVRT
jgi:arsenite-transporting ATPase